LYGKKDRENTVLIKCYNHFFFFLSAVEIKAVSAVGGYAGKILPGGYCYYGYG
jgi:hypothetical protein